MELPPIPAITDVEVRWNIELAGPKLGPSPDAARLQSLFEFPNSGRGQKCILQIEDEAVLNCKLEELSALVRELVRIDKFDVAELSDFTSLAVLYRERKQGLRNLVVKPAPFSRRLIQGRRPSSGASSTGTGSGTIIKHQKNPSRGIFIGAFAFFVIVVLGLMFYGASRGPRRR